jgi:hypothetical protein
VDFSTPPTLLAINPVAVAVSVQFQTYATLVRLLVVLGGLFFWGWALTTRRQQVAAQLGTGTEMAAMVGM